MCGIAGMAGKKADPALVQRMVDCLAHRGPDNHGVFADRTMAMGQSRLSIIDLSTGDQPMANEDKTVWVAYNGEIYNFKALRKDLESRGHVFSTTSDTEVLVHGYEEYGTGFFEKLDGIFAFALWDQLKKRLVLCRDYFGVKPLHYFREGDRLVFGSEIKALFVDPDITRKPDLQALHYFMNVRYVPGERTLFDRVRRLPAGHFLVWEKGDLTITPYFRPHIPQYGRQSQGELMEGIRHYLGRAVKKQMVSDVPLGVFLSGGMDSSALVAYMSEASSGPVKTFSLGFDEPTDELEDARVVAERFGAEHHEMVLSPDPLKYFPQVIWHTEEPKENILQGFLLSRFAREHVKVVQGGLGGDEIFAGYFLNRFVHPLRGFFPQRPNWLARGPQKAASGLAFGLQNLLGPLWTDEYRRAAQLLLSVGDLESYYLILRNAWDRDPGAWKQRYGRAMLDYGPGPVHEAFDAYFENGPADPVGRVLWAEFHTKMRDDFLLNEDRTSMAHGLEVRVPFLDRDLVRFAMDIPPGLHMKGNQTKYLFRKAMKGILPEHTLGKKKWGFTFDSYYQFQKDLKKAAGRILTRKRVQDRGWFNYQYLERILSHPPHPRMRWHYFFLWLAMGLEIWARMFLEGDPARPDLELESYYD